MPPSTSSHTVNLNQLISFKRDSMIFFWACSSHLKQFSSSYFFAHEYKHFFPIFQIAVTPLTIHIIVENKTEEMQAVIPTVMFLYFHRYTSNLLTFDPKHNCYHNKKIKNRSNLHPSSTFEHNKEHKISPNPPTPPPPLSHINSSQKLVPVCQSHRILKFHPHHHLRSPSSLSLKVC